MASTVQEKVAAHGPSRIAHRLWRLATSRALLTWACSVAPSLCATIARKRCCHEDRIHS